MPTPTRNVSGMAVRAGTELLLIDCGEGSQRQMVRFGTGFDLSAVFFTHFHADHFLGIIGFVRTLSMLGRQEPLEMFGPAGAESVIQHAIDVGGERPAFPIRVRSLHGGDVVERRGFSVRAVEVIHRVKSLGYVLYEHPRPGVFDPVAAQALGVPAGPLFGRLQSGIPVELPDGRRIEPSTVVQPARAGRCLVVSGDTRPCDALTHAARGADVLVHEATFGNDQQERAIETGHSTAAEAAGVALRAGVGHLILTHFSSRNEHRGEALRREAAQVFAGPIDAAVDGFELSIPPRQSVEIPSP